MKNIVENNIYLTPGEKKKILENKSDVANMLVMNFFAYVVFYKQFGHIPIQAQLMNHDVPKNVLAIDDETSHSAYISIGLALQAHLVNLRQAKKMFSITTSLFRGALSVSKEDIADHMKQLKMDTLTGSKLQALVKAYIAEEDDEKANINFLKGIFKLSQGYNRTQSINAVLRRVRIDAIE